jgi:2-polyprenyl-3-methyl-5-hydroxy-6-metoxy-1,4-benzoquinol methylase
MQKSKPVSDNPHARNAFQTMEQVHCPICGMEPVRFAVDHQGFHLCRCPECRLEFVNPRPVFDELRSKVYNEEYFPPSSMAREPDLSRRYQFSRQLRTLQKFSKKKGRLLDVGCGDGSFLEFAQQAGWTVTGMDIRLSREARELSCRLMEGRLGQIDLEPRSFDVIRFNHVLEHTQNPMAELERSRQLVAENGLIFISVPNLAGISAWLKSFQSRFHLKSHRWRHYAAIHHLWYFTPASLKALVEKAGLRTLLWETPVLKKSDCGPIGESLYRYILEKPRCASILDIYCTPRV